MNIVYFGTPHFAAEVLAYLLDCKITPVAVVTQPDRPKGRSLKMSPSAVKSKVLEKAPSIPVFQPHKASEDPFLESLRDLQPDLFVVVAYGQILPQKLLDIPKVCCINVHASLLPKYRGAAPIQRCIMAGEKETGISIQKMVLKMDAGDVIAEAKMPLPDDMTFGELEERLIDLTKPLLVQVIGDLKKGVPIGVPQDPSKVSFAPKIDPNEGEINWNLPAEVIHNLIRGLSPKPGAWSLVGPEGAKKRLKILKARLSTIEGKPGEVRPSGIVCCKEGSIELQRVQPEGKKAMDAVDWLRGYHLSKF